ncbi:MAG: Mu transposase C-terminal domain-containing protein [Gammaproteobacteria bacterium]|nr:Mu transposase C-terminal domain-containing protein [Gammaproteobacteria bacterium]
MSQPATQLIPTALPRTPAPRPAAAETLEFKRHVVQRVIALMHDGATFRAAVVAVADTEVWPTGAKRGRLVSERSIAGWYSQMKRRGATGVVRQPRGDIGRRRVAISRKWDKLAERCGIDAEGRERIAAEMVEAIRGAYQSGVASASQVQYDVRPDLRDKTKAAATVPPDDAELLKASRIPEDFIRRYQIDKLHAIHRADKGRWSNEIVARVKRSREGLRRMEWVAGDVHPLDVVLRRDDGSTFHPSLIAWEDLATNDLFLSVATPEKGRNVGRADIIESFAEMSADSQWGVPTNLYLDNGKEYNGLELADDMMALSKLANSELNLWEDREAFDSRRHGVLRSTAYQPQGKIIEGFFSNFERYLSRLPGYTGGDRMNKRTDVLGHKPTPYTAGVAKFKEDVESALMEYRQVKQRGHLDGRSPHEATQEQIDKGWRSVVLDPSHLNIVFADVHRRQVQSDGIHYGKRIYYSDALKQRTLPGQWVQVRVPIMGDGELLYVMDGDGNPVCTVSEAPVYAQDDLRGPNEIKRRKRAQLAHLAATRVDFDADAGARMRRAASVDPVPQAQVGAYLSVDPGWAKLADEGRELLEGPRAPARAPKTTEGGA